MTRSRSHIDFVRWSNSDFLQLSVVDNKEKINYSNLDLLLLFHVDNEKEIKGKWKSLCDARQKPQMSRSLGYICPCVWHYKAKPQVGTTVTWEYTCAAVEGVYHSPLGSGEVCTHQTFHLYYFDSILWFCVMFNVGLEGWYTELFIPLFGFFLEYQITCCWRVCMFVAMHFSHGHAYS